MPFDGLRVLSLESRRDAEIEMVIVREAAMPSPLRRMREIPLEDNAQIFPSANALFAVRDESAD